jgi:hypothetical protein
MTKAINVDIITNYKGADNLKKVHKDILGLGSAVKTLGGLFAVGSVLAFGKASVTAFMQADQAFKVLSNTLKNLGLESQAVGIQDYVDKLALTTGVVKESLIPAFQTLAT